MRRVGPLVIAVLLCTGCSAKPSADPPPEGPALRPGQVSYVGHIHGGIGSYAAQTKVIDAQRSLARGQSGRLIVIRGIGSVPVTCSDHPVAVFRPTSWAQGEGPPTVTRAIASTHGLTSLAGLAATYTVPKPETTRQHLYQWQISDGGGEAFQFSATVTVLVTQTTRRCDLLAEATVVTTGRFYRYAH